MSNNFVKLDLRKKKFRSCGTGNKKPAWKNGKNFKGGDQVCCFRPVTEGRSGISRPWPSEEQILAKEVHG